MRELLKSTKAIQHYFGTNFLNKIMSKKFNILVKDKIKPFNKSIRVDSDKSISIRSLLIGAISRNISCIKNILKSEDVISAWTLLKS